jgi:ABC-type phosphate transport system auxiliary subunit
MSAATSNSKLEDPHNGAPSDAEASATAQARSGSEVSGPKKQRISSSLKRVIDETQLPPEEAEQLESRRAYNRECATRARKRTKNLVAQLSDQVRNLQADKDDLRRENAVIRAQLQSIERQNQTLAFKHGLVERHHANMSMSAHMSPFVPSPMGGFLQPRMNLDTALTNLLSAQQAAARNQLPNP